jgi:type IV secretion system protein VirB9
MLKKLSLIVFIIFVIFIIRSAYAEAISESLPTDARAKVVGFNPYQIYVIKTHYLVSTDIIFGEDEVIDNGDVHLGDAASWDVDANRNHLYIKAKKMGASGNMSVITNKYSYHFILSVSDSPVVSNEQTLFLKFTYPTHGEDEKKLALQLVTVPSDICINSRKYNLKYSFTGDQELAPLRACDDGIFTYFKFRRQVDLPAIFMVLPDKSEQVVNYRVEGSYVVVERVAKAFTLRNGSTVTSVYNDKTIGDWDRVGDKTW